MPNSNQIHSTLLKHHHVSDIPYIIHKLNYVIMYKKIYIPFFLSSLRIPNLRLFGAIFKSSELERINLTMSSLIGLTGFTIGLTQILRPKITFSLWEFIKKFIFTLVKFMGFSDSPETETHLRENQTPIPAELIRELLPLIKISEESATAHGGNGDMSGNCAVCLCEYVGGEEISCLRICKHVFHRSCVDHWMDRDRWTCPLCRTPIMPPHFLPEVDRRLRDTSDFVAANVFVDQDSEDHAM